MPKSEKADLLAEIEEAQEQLRENIEESKVLVEQTQRLLEKVKEESSD